MPLGDGIGGIIDLIKKLGEMAPLILQLIECFKDLAPDKQAKHLTFFAKLVSPDPDKQEAFKSQFMSLVAKE